jgi:hypothetical protein
VRKRLMVAFVAAAMVMGLAGVADAAKPDRQDKPEETQETGEACPDSSPRGAEDPDATPPPGCGQVDRDRGGSEGPTGPDDPQGSNECPPNSQNPGAAPPNCGNQDPGADECDDDETFNEETGECEADQVEACDEGETRNEETGECEADQVEAQECTEDLGQLVVGIPAAPLAEACVVLGSVEDRDPPCPAGAIETGVISAHPLAKLCATVGPNS